MDNQDKYTIGIRNEFLCYFKNGEIHREAGPAVFLIEDADKYFYLGDKDLYIAEELRPTIAMTQDEHNLLKSYLFHLQTTHTNTPAYYLEGQEYDEKSWSSLMGKKKLQEELSKDLPQTEEKIKKPKI